MPSTERVPRSDAIAVAKRFVAALGGTYDQLVVGGSLRRRLAFVHDIEVVATPRVEAVDEVIPGLFGEDVRQVQVNRLDARMEEMLAVGQVQKRLDVAGNPRWGSALRYLTFDGAPVDLFTPVAARFGWILLLRTGPAAFSRQLVVPKGQRTKDRRPGLMPAYIKPDEGWLTYRTSGERISTPDEQSVFDLFGIPFVDPWSRV